MPNQLPMAFKGGTSLSKVFRAIQRFSEDVDITISYQAFHGDDLLQRNTSKTQLKKISEQIRLKVTENIRDIIHPYYENVVDKQFKDNRPKLELDNDKETLLLYYKSALQKKSEYVQESIRLEFGGRNLTIPNDTHTIAPDIAEHLSALEFPNAQIFVLSPQKTFWEKITLIHSECNRPTKKVDANRISRHWYDVAMLSKHDIGIQALSNIPLLNEVVKIKKIFYDSSYAKYDDCINGKLCLVPETSRRKLLKDDFDKMLSEKMFYGEQPLFDGIMEQMSTLEKQINQQNKLR